MAWRGFEDPPNIGLVKAALRKLEGTHKMPRVIEAVIFTGGVVRPDPKQTRFA